MGKHSFKLIASLAVCQLAGIVGSGFVWPAIPGWYAQLIKPELTPPAVVFGVVWWVLYTLMGISLYLVWTSPVSTKRKREPMFLFLIHLITNAGWTYIFFGQQNLALAFVDILLLGLMVTILIYKFSSISRIATLLLIPYLAWVAFAAYLNYGLLLLNR